MDFDTETFIAHTLRGEGFDASEDGTGRGIPLVPVVFQERGRNGERDLNTQENLAYSLTSPKGGGRRQELNVAIPILEAGARTGRSTDDPRAGMGVGAENYSNPKPGDPCHPLAASAHVPAIAFNLRGRDDGAQPELSDVASIRASQGGSSRSYVASLPQGYRPQTPDSVGETITANPAGGMKISPVATQTAVRRLSVVECCRLQAFPDTYTHIPYGRPRKIESDEAAYLAHHGLHVWQNGEQWMTDIAADGNMYRALGNSMATCVVRWLGDRIRTVHAAFIAEQENAA